MAKSPPESTPHTRTNNYSHNFPNHKPTQQQQTPQTTKTTHKHYDSTKTTQTPPNQTHSKSQKQQYQNNKPRINTDSNHSDKHHKNTKQLRTKQLQTNPQLAQQRTHKHRIKQNTQAFETMPELAQQRRHNTTTPTRLKSYAPTLSAVPFFKLSKRNPLLWYTTNQVCLLRCSHTCNALCLTTPHKQPTTTAKPTSSASGSQNYASQSAARSNKHSTPTNNSAKANPPSLDQTVQQLLETVRNLYMF